MKLTKTQINKVTEALKKMKIKKKETPACEHQKLLKIKKEGLWYQCQKCRQIFFIFGCVVYNKDLVKQDLEEILKNAK